MDNDSCKDWVAIEQFPAFEVSNDGRIRGPRGARKAWVNENGYVMIGFACGPRRTKHFRVHVLVAAAFIGPKPIGMDINHKDGNKQNNRVENLEYMTRSENCKHGFRLGLSYTPFREFKGVNHPNSKIQDSDVRTIREEYAKGTSRRDLATRFGLSYYTVWDITERRSWKHI